jgi:hypothetical protein
MPEILVAWCFDLNSVAESRDSSVHCSSLSQVKSILRPDPYRQDRILEQVATGIAIGKSVVSYQEVFARALNSRYVTMRKLKWLRSSFTLLLCVVL